MMPTVKCGQNRPILSNELWHCSRQEDMLFMPNYGVKTLFYCQFHEITQKVSLLPTVLANHDADT